MYLQCASALQYSIPPHHSQKRKAVPFLCIFVVIIERSLLIHPRKLVNKIGEDNWQSQPCHT
ncbi:TPA: hypothetical protein RJX14_001823 [Legionella pneumophila]|nr:hypothetical protein [Legionella pneumophila]HDV6633022.1 hypothetical protein [Legionella pneumophila]